MDPIPLAPNRGFTLLEMLVALAVVSVLTAIAAPSFRAMSDSIRLTSAANSFLAHLYLARSEAIKRRGRVVLCKSSDHHTCATSGGWEQGRVIFLDANNNGMLDPGELVIAHEERLQPDLRLRGNLTVARYVSFDELGATRLVGGGFQAGTLTLCRQALARTEARQIIVNALGRPRVRRVHLDECM